MSWQSVTGAMRIASESAANQSFERTGLGARGSLRSMSAFAARRSTQIR
jgi:hypothetical protein